MKAIFSVIMNFKSKYYGQNGSQNGLVVNFQDTTVSVYKVRDFYIKVLKEDERQRLCKNIADHLKDAQLFIQKRAVSSLDIFCLRSSFQTSMQCSNFSSKYQYAYGEGQEF